MRFKVDKIDIPKGSEISKTLADAYYFDTYQFTTEQKERSPLQIWLDHSSKTPAWINFLMTMRNKIVSVLGLKNLGHLRASDAEKLADDYKVGVLNFIRSRGISRPARIPFEQNFLRAPRC